MLIQENIPLAKYTSFHLGGSARFFVLISSVDELQEALTFAAAHRVPWFVLGGGSNVLVSDAGFPGLVIKIAMNKISVQDTLVVAEAGAATAQVAAISVARGLTGFEWAAGVPGTIGGGVRGNAGAMGGEIKDTLQSVIVFRGGEMQTMTNTDCEFAYRESIFKKHADWIVLNATFALQPGNKEEGMTRIRQYLEHRNTTQPKKYGSSGCGFKNVETAHLAAAQIARLKATGVPPAMLERGRVSSGWLIEHAGLAGVREGGAMVSDVHCNFIVNGGGATSAEVKRLIDRVRTMVKERFGVDLEEEIIYIGFSE